MSADNTTGDWLSTAAPALEKVSDLQQGADLNYYASICTPFTFTNSAGQTLSTCSYQTSLGLVTGDGYISTGGGSFVQLRGVTNSSSLIPSKGIIGDLAIMPNGLSYGAYIGVYLHLSKKDLALNTPAVGTPYYSITTQPDLYLTNPATNAKLTFDPASIAFSSNGEWMVARLPGVGLVRMNTADYSTQLFAGPIEPNGYNLSSNTQTPMAVTDDGRYVAANTDVYSSNRMMVYDLSTCTDQFGAVQPKYCASKNIWDGGAGILSANPNMKYPVQPRFVSDDSLDFVARYDVQSNTDYKVGEFVATAPGGTAHRLGLLGMGDSYIAGQGTFVYHDGTNTSDNSCHESDYAYPFLLGREYFDTYNSVACSGATTGDVVGIDSKYKGQNSDGIPEFERDKAPILESFDPGYIYQQEFVKEYKPQAIILSVGGNDIGFSDIIKRCVLPVDGTTCYDNYEDRAELVQTINDKYATLVKTYRSLHQQSGGSRIYVVGYPQIAEPGGTCGVDVLLNSAEVEFSTQIISYLDSVIKEAADTAGVFYVDTQSAFDGHKLCESGMPAMNGLTVQRNPHSLVPVAPESYHPTQYGYELLAETIAAETDNLQAAMPTPQTYDPPVFDPNLSMLSGVPLANRIVNVVGYSPDLIGDVVLDGDTQQITVNGNDMQLQPNSNYQIVLHSTPVTLGTGTADQDGNINTQITIPADTEPGYHTLHVYGTDMAGHPVDIQKIIYVSDGTEYGNETLPESGDAGSQNDDTPGDTTTTTQTNDSQSSGTSQGDPDGAPTDPAATGQNQGNDTPPATNDSNAGLGGSAAGWRWRPMRNAFNNAPPKHIKPARPKTHKLAVFLRAAVKPVTAYVISCCRKHF